MQAIQTTAGQAGRVSSRSAHRTLPSGFWLVHLALPALAFVLSLLAFQLLPIDTFIARRWAYDPSLGRWIGHGRWWADEILHTDGRIAILLVIGGLLVALGASGLHRRLHAARGTTIYLLATIALAWGLVGTLKQVTNVPCPWSLQGFGGERPHVGLFDPRPSGYSPAACFPGAHSASGFSLFAFYFAFRDRRRRRARKLLAVATVVGAAFAFGQEARGAHFLSHDVASAFIAWFVALGTYMLWRRFARSRYPERARFEFATEPPPPGALPIPVPSERTAEYDPEHR
jgi:membrane-associated PAP2 superfamily phosphatase